MSRKFFSGPFILILPSILAIGFVIIIPLIFSFYTSFTSYKLTTQKNEYITLATPFHLYSWERERGKYCYQLFEGYRNNHNLWLQEQQQ